MKNLIPVAVGSLTIMGAIFYLGWDMAVVAGNVKANTKQLQEGKAFVFDMQQWRYGHETSFVEQVLKSQHREQRLLKLEKADEFRYNRIIDLLQGIKDKP